MIAGDRLVQIAGISGDSGVLLLMIGTGSTSGDALVNYSKLPSGTAAQHLLTDIAASVSSWLTLARRRSRR